MAVLLASTLLFVSGCFNAFIVVIISYLEKYRGFPWIMIYILSEWISIPLIFIFSLFYMWYYYCRYVEHEQTSSSIAITTHTFNLSFVQYYYYLIFPPMTKRFRISWMILDLRALASSTSYIFCMIAIMYIDSGDFILIQTVVLTVGNIIVGRVLFNEYLNATIIISLVVCIIGVICVCQPSYIFESFLSDDNNGTVDIRPVDTVGFIFALISGLLRVFTAGVCKYSKTSVDMPWLTLFTVSNIIGFFLSTVIFVAIITVMKFILDMPSGDIWYNFDYSGKSKYSYDDTMYGLLILGIGGFTFISAITGTLGWRLGDVGRLGMVINADIPVAYIAQMVLLNEDSNVLTYTGICLVFLSIIMIFYSQSQRDIDSETEEQGYQIISADDDTRLTGNACDSDAFYDLEFILQERNFQLTVPIDTTDSRIVVNHNIDDDSDSSISDCGDNYGAMAIAIGTSNHQDYNSVSICI